MNRKTLATAVGSAVLGGLGVGYLTLGPSASADPFSLAGGTTQVLAEDATQALVDDTTTDDSTTTDDTGGPATPPADQPDPSERFKTHIQDALAPLLADGTLSQDDIDKIIAALETVRPEGPMGRRGPGGPDGRHGPHVRLGTERGEILTVVAQKLNMTVDALRTELQAGKTIAEVATAASVDPQTVIDALVVSITDKIDQKVADGSLTADRAAQIKADLVDRVTKMINETGPHPHGPMRQPSDDDGTETGS